MDQTVEGKVAGFREGSEDDPFAGQGGSLRVWDFRVETYDENGDLADVIPVQMKGRGFTGVLHDGDDVRIAVPHAHDRSEALKAREIERVILAGGQRRLQLIRAREPWPRPWMAALIAVGMVAAFVLFVLWGISRVNQPVPTFPIQSSGTTTVPEVTGFELVRAASAMGDAGLTFVTAEASSATVPFGRVIRTEPQAGTTVKQGSRVTLFVSMGP